MKTNRFIWLPTQPVDHAAGFTTLRGTPLRREGEGVNRWILARGMFDVPAGITAASLSITADGRYRAWLNGEHLGRGPVRATPAFQRFDSYDVAKGIVEGRNQLAVLVHVPGVDLAWYETMRGGWQPVFGDGGLAVEWTLETPGSTETGGSDASWRIRECDAWARDTPRGGWGQDFIEDFDARRIDAGWIAADFDDSDWPNARIMIAQPAADVAARGWGAVRPFPILVPSQLPAAVEAERRPNRILWVRPIERISASVTALYGDLLGAIDWASTKQAARVLAEAGSDAEPAAGFVAGNDTAMLLAFDPYHAGRPFIEIEAEGGEVIEIAVAESLPGEFGRGCAGDGLRGEGHLGCANVFRYTARSGRQRFERFNWTAVRAMQVVVRNAPRGLRILEIGSIATNYPVRREGSFTCSDPFLEQLWHVARDTVGHCMHDAWVDCPGREARQWVGDPIVMFDVAAMGFGPSVFALHRQFLHQVSESQRQDGLVRMFAPGDIAADALTIPDFTLLWIIGIERYWRASADSATIEALMPPIERALAWFDRLANANGLLADVPQWHFIEWADLDRRGESAAINMLFVGALAAAATLAAVAGCDRLAERWSARGRAVADAINRRHWDEGRGVYVDSVDPDSGTRRARVSQHANALAILFDVAPPGRWSAIADVITDGARLKLTAAPPIVPDAQAFDDQNDVVRANSFFSHFVLAGLARAGRAGWVVDDLRRAFGPMLGLGATTLWESFSPAASLCHGFSSTPLYQLSAHVLGVAAVEAGFAQFAVDPDTSGLDHASGVVPTPHGPIEIAWRREDGRTHIEIRHPVACQLLPARAALVSEVRQDGVVRRVMA